MVSLYRLRLFLLIDILLIIMGIAGAMRVAARAGLPLWLARENSHVVISEIRIPQPAVDLQPGDIILAVDHQTVSSIMAAEFLIDHGKIGDFIPLAIQRGNSRLELSVQLIPYYGWLYLLIQGAVAALFFFLGILVLLKRPDDIAANVFHWASIAIAVMIMSTWASYTIPPFGLGYAVQVLDLFANALIPVLFVHFSLVFPRTRQHSMRRKAIIPLHVLTIGFLAWMCVSFFLSISPPSSQAFQRFLVAFYAFRVFFMVCITIGVVNLFHSYFTAVEASERRKLLWVVSGLSIGSLGFLALWALPQILFGHPFVIGEVIILVSAVIPASFAISIIRDQVMDINLIFNRGAVYTLVAGVLLAMYAAIVGIVAAIVGTFTIRTSMLASALGMSAVALLFEPTRRYSQRLIDRIFFRTRYDYRQAQRRFLEELKNCFEVRQLAEFMVREIDDLLKVTCVGFYGPGESDSPLSLLAERNGALLAAYDIPELIQHLNPQPHIPLGRQERVEPGISLEPVEPETFRKLGITVVYTLFSEQSEILGMVIIGDRKSGARFNVEDMDLLGTMATQAALALERIALQQKLLLERAETQRLEELSQLKSYFVSSVSHELKTPLTSIKMFAEMLRNQKNLGAARQREYCEIIEGESNRLSQLIENVLDFASMERGLKEYHLSGVDLNGIVQKAMKSLEYQLKMQQFQLEIRLAREHTSIRADPDAVMEALINVLGNAMRYSPEDKWVRITTVHRNGFWGVVVEDHGLGIPASDQERIFEPFYRVTAGEPRRAAGTGLGLALVKHIMDAHAGRVEVSSQPGKGSTFTLLFPMEERNETHPDR